jgi:hypothetical protein
MGADCSSCQKVESEEETFMRIFSSLNLVEIETKSAYAEFTRCIHKEDGYLDFFLFKNFLNKIVGENNYKTAQICYFENLRKMDSKKQNIKKIGSLIIFLTKGTKYQKEELLFEHYMKYYTLIDEKTVKEFIADLIEVNTDNCINSFRENLDYETVKTMTDVYKKIRKRQLLYHIYANFERVRIKYFHRSPNINTKISKVSDKLNNSFDMDNVNIHDLGMIEEDQTIKFKDDIFEAYERYSKNQCDPLHQFVLDSKKLNQEEKIVKEFIELAFNHLIGEYMRNWLYEAYMREKTYENVCI